MNWNPLSGLWDKIKDMFNQCLDFIIKPFQFVIDGIKGVLLVITTIIDDWTDYLIELKTDVFDDILIHQRVPELPTSIQDIMQICNGFFPLDLFVELCKAVIIVYISVLAVRLALRVITLGQW